MVMSSMALGVLLQPYSPFMKVFGILKGLL